MNTFHLSKLPRSAARKGYFAGNTFNEKNACRTIRCSRYFSLYCFWPFLHSSPRRSTTTKGF